MHASDLVVPLIIALVAGGITGLIVWKAYDVKDWVGKLQDRYR
jgi:hypothetical protein